MNWKRASLDPPDELLASALQLGRKYHFDEPHAERVARFASELFDRTRRLHRLEDGDRLLLEVAAWLHDIGQYVSYASHHKHSYYLIRSSHLVGLDNAGRKWWPMWRDTTASPRRG